MYDSLRTFETEEECEESLSAIQEEEQEEPVEEEPIEETPTEETTEENQIPVLEKEIPDINMEMNSAYTLDLNEFFTDPDNDELFYTAVKPANITLQMVKNVVTIKPEQGFEGERILVFYASDGTESVSSNEIKINVGKQQQKPLISLNFSELIYKYRYYLIGAGIIVVIIIILLSGLGEKIVDFFEEEVEEKPKNNNNKKEEK